MNEKFIKIKTNWKVSRGDVNESIIAKIYDEPPVEKPLLEDIVSFERSTFLQQNSNEDEQNDKCELELNIFPHYTVDSVAVVTDCPRIEIFLNSQGEYYETLCGELLDDFDGKKIYRFDIKMDKKNICASEISVKFISKMQEIWIYGIHMELIRNSKPLIGLSSINLDNVQKILSESQHKLSPNAERCKDFLENYKKIRTGNAGNISQFEATIQTFFGTNNSDLIANVKLLNGVPEFKKILSTENEETVLNQILPHMLDKKCKKEEEFLLLNGKKSNNEKKITNDSLETLKHYIDEKISDAESRIHSQIEIMEQKQNEKLDKILKLLEKNIKPF